MKKRPVVLGIETSCDETSAAVVRAGKALSSVVSSQIALHAPYHGVVPELASRAHLQRIALVIEQALDQAFPKRGKKPLSKLLDAVAFTQGPGLMGPLLVGKVAAQTLSAMSGLPLVGVNHLEGHALAHEFVREMKFPLISLIVSGGHTDLVLVKGRGKYKVLGRTRDDAAGEAYDKVAKLLNLGYPGGPIVDKTARLGDKTAITFPRPNLPGTWDFSFSGLKTAVFYYMKDHPKAKTADVCAAFQEAVAETLADKALAAAKQYKTPRIVVGGGVAANSRLREVLAEKAAAAGVDALFTPLKFCGDNGAMIAHVAALRLEARGLPKARSWRVNPELAMTGW